MKFSKSSLKGIFDTDGSLFLTRKSHRNDYPIIEISTTSPALANQLNSVLVNKFRIGFRYFDPINFHRLYRISLNGEEMVDLWFKEIGSSNPKNLEIYKKLKNGDGGI